MSKPIRTVPALSEEIVLVCRKCSKKIGGGFGPDGDAPLDKALRRALGLAKGRKSRVRFVRVPCFDICPRNAVTVAKGSEPEKLYIIPRETAPDTIAAALGLDTEPSAVDA